MENEQLRSGIATPSNGTSAAAAAKISQLESKLLTQQEQLTDLHKRKGENSQMIIDLNLKLEKQNKLLADRESRYNFQIYCSVIDHDFIELMYRISLIPFASIAEHIAVNTTLRAEVLMLNTSMQELKSLNSCLRDEHCALQLAFASLEEKLRKVQVWKWIWILDWWTHFLTMTLIQFQDENRQLVDRLIKYKAKDAEKLNEENESFLKYVWIYWHTFDHSIYMW